MSTTSNEKSYFDLHTSGIGYLHRAREVPVEDDDPYLAVTVAALVGSCNDPTYRYFDVKVSGAEAQELVSQYIGLNDLKRRPLVRFRIGDIWPDPYFRTAGDRKGELAASIKGRLIKADLIDRTELAKIERHELITRGIGYLNDPTDVSPPAGDPFLACTVAALTGRIGAKKRRYRYFDTIVATEDAQHLVRRCVQAIKADRKVLIAFRLNDMEIDPYVRTKGDKAGQPAGNLKADLVHISQIKIDGTQVYPTSQAQAEVAADTAADQPAEPAEREPEAQVNEQEPVMAESF